MSRIAEPKDYLNHRGSFAACRHPARRKVFVTRAIDPAALERLRAAATVTVWRDELPPPESVLRSTLKNADAVLSMVTDKIDARMIAEAAQLRVISNLAVGVDNIDLDAATRAGIAVGHTPGVLTEATADLAFGLLMATARRIAEADRHVRAGEVAHLGTDDAARPRRAFEHARADWIRCDRPGDGAPGGGLRDARALSHSSVEQATQRPRRRCGGCQLCRGCWPIPTTCRFMYR